MSVYYLQGCLFPKTKNLPELKEVFELFKSSDLLEFDVKFRELIERKIPQKERFFKEDFGFHLNLLKKEEEEKKFVQGIFLPFDVFRFLTIKKEIFSKSILGYFTNEELKEILNKKFPEKMDFQIKKFFEEKLMKVEKVNEKIKKEILKLQKKLLMAKFSRLISLYLDLENLPEEKIEKRLKKMFSRIIYFKKFSPGEIARFYLPYFFKRKLFYITQPFEFLFFYLKERFILWKILNPNLI